MITINIKTTSNIRVLLKKVVDYSISPDGNGKPRRNKPIFSCGARATNESSMRHNRKKGL
ncbi:hypothetical protein B0E44_01730 [Flavobacterium sp. A45]|nr:hypothetical protein B0E44_01730 [Flavobacterium sp. A45]